MHPSLLMWAFTELPNLSIFFLSHNIPKMILEGKSVCGGVLLDWVFSSSASLVVFGEEADF